MNVYPARFHDDLADLYAKRGSHLGNDNVERLGVLCIWGDALAFGGELDSVFEHHHLADIGPYIVFDLLAELNDKAIDDLAHLVVNVGLELHVVPGRVGLARRLEFILNGPIRAATAAQRHAATDLDRLVVHGLVDTDFGKNLNGNLLLVGELVAETADLGGQKVADGAVFHLKARRNFGFTSNLKAEGEVVCARCHLFRSLGRRPKSYFLPKK